MITKKEHEAQAAQLWAEYMAQAARLRAECKAVQGR